LLADARSPDRRSRSGGPILAGHHRVADGAQVAQFICELRGLIELPEAALLDPWASFFLANTCAET